MIAIEELRFAYAAGGFALDIPALSIDPGTTAAVVGPSGCGKTTLLQLVAGVMAPDRGRVRVGETDVTALADAACRSFRIRTIGMVFQEFELIEHLGVVDNIALPARISNDVALDRARAVGLAEGVGLGDKLDRGPRRLSQGERQRVAVCRALYTRPSLILADEPTGNLDPDNAAHVLGILFDYVKAEGATLLAVMHDRTLLDRFERILDLGPGAENWA
ncbi:MAG: ABC transporter ATP-binding protein [Planctomycetota bacterium]